MKKFFFKLFLFVGLFLIISGAFLVLSAQEHLRMKIADLTGSGDYAYEDFGAKEIVPFVERVQEQNDCSKLIIGDSVCNQIFERYYEMNDVYCICGSNQAISLSGQYILAKEFIKNHENVTDIYLILTMGSLGTGYGSKLGYQYAVMPFVLTDTIGNLDDETCDLMAKRYGRLFCQKPIVKLIDQSPLNMKLYLNMLAKKDEMFPMETDDVISGVSYKYLHEFQTLCESEDVNFHLIPGPHAESDARHNLEQQLRDEIMINGDSDISTLKSYPDQIIYYPEELFRDGIHFDEKKVDDAFFAELAQRLIPDVCTQ